MFGYVKPCKGELKIKHWNLYRGFYCGVCRALGKRYGQGARLLLNYDTAFLAIMLAARDSEYTLKPGRCLIKSKKQLFAYGKAIDLAADINILLAYYKFKDDWHDEKSIAGIMGKIIYGLGAKKAGQYHSEIENLLHKMTEDEKLVESIQCQSPDLAATPFTEMMSGLAKYLTDGDEKFKQFYQSLGKWLYIIDAVDDLETDLKKNNYNPFKEQLENSSLEQLRQNVDPVLCLYMQDIANIFDQLDLKDEDLKSIIENIVLAGLLEKTDIVLMKKGCDCSGSKESI